MALYYQYHIEKLNTTKKRAQKRIRPIFFISLVISFSCFIFFNFKRYPFINKIDNFVSHNKGEPLYVEKAGFGNVLVKREESISDFLKEHSYSKVVLEGELNRGGSIYNCLNGAGISDRDIQLIASKFKTMFNFSTQSRPGDKYRLILTNDGKIDKFEYQRGPLEVYCLAKDGNDNWNVWQENIKLMKYWVRISGQIRDSLFSTFQREGYPVSLAAQFAEIFEWKIDFQHEVREGDYFSLVVEKFYKDGELIEYGRIVAAMYDGEIINMLKGFYFEQDNGIGDYYSPDGTSLKRAFLRSPLSYKYISSGFSYRRKHPILGSVKPHLGIDFAAPYGSPVWAVADGTVISKTYDRYNGNQIKLRHINNYITYYNHLSRFAGGLKRGVKVKQKQIIGYVGTSGLSTGPHLDYRVKKNNSYVNPLKANYPLGEALKKVFIQSYMETVSNLNTILMDDDMTNMFLVAEVDFSGKKGKGSGAFLKDKF